MLRLTEQSIANAEWMTSESHPHPEWWFGYRAALLHVLWTDGGG